MRQISTLHRKWTILFWVWCIFLMIKICKYGMWQKSTSVQEYLRCVSVNGAHVLASSEAPSHSLTKHQQRRKELVLKPFTPRGMSREGIVGLWSEQRLSHVFIACPGNTNALLSWVIHSALRQDDVCMLSGDLPASFPHQILELSGSSAERVSFVTFDPAQTIPRCCTVLHQRLSNPLLQN